MCEDNQQARRRAGVIAFAASLPALICAAPAFGQAGPDPEPAPDKKVEARPPAAKPPTVSRTKATSPNPMVNLVNLLVQQGVIKEEQGRMLIKQAEDQAYVASQAAKTASAKADDAAKTASAAAAVASPPGVRHVTYVPEIVKRQLREEIKQEVMAKAEAENWASPGRYPEWAQRIHFYGDVRTRYQGNFFPGGNDQAGAANFNAVNTGPPYDVSSANPYFGPTYDATQDRNQFRFRGRLGMDADLTNGFDAGIRIATGQDSQPVSTNQTLGASGGNFSKYAVWLDRGYLKYNWQDDLTASSGRFDNPFWSPTDLVWYRELAFDGFAVQAKHEVLENFTPFVVAGAFPIYNTDFNAGINLADTATGQPTKLPNSNKWLLGAQLGFSYKFQPDVTARLAAAYYDFTDVQGQLSAPCIVYTASDVCSTDPTRPSFAQKGNTYRYLRNIVANAQNQFGTINQFQYFGLVSQFRPVVATGELDFDHFDPVHVVLDGEYVVNTAFNRNLMNALAVNNRAGTPTGALGTYNGGNIGWLARLTVGDAKIEHLWDWNVNVGYKYLQSDAVIDAFTDPDFGLGGTNLKGYIIGGNLGLSNNVWATLRWMSANNIGGAPFAVDTLQLDLNAKF
jgi:hypothetical protein